MPYQNAIEEGSLRIKDPEASADKSALTYDEIVAACMKEEGFEYWPTSEPDEDVTGSEAIDDDKELSKRARDGYGIVLPYDKLYKASSQSLGPNEEYFSMMSDEMREEYTRVLSGTIWDELSAASQTGEEVDWDWRRGGCDGKATHLIEERASQGEQAENAQTTQFDDLIDQMNALPEQIPQDKDWEKVLERWSQCMSSGGFDFSSWDQAQDSIVEEFDTLASEASMDKIAEEGSSADPYKPDKGAYEKLYDREREIAVADWQCQIDTGRAEAERRILYGIEKDFVDTHFESLERMKKWFDAKG
ncbi:hypothetical protein G7068_10595 [Leucobacter viscericola]|uniref:Uncharacterized protein n=1 Tax=Leucobacter viscericola TaxID=2714935 RepID=A0A6G7XGG0_9MICO|nr:hypothetical protein [Leucobacter viscericola]QIK63592.1 hypothetical protein G7068_10595 [Leucobacter viscericola]